MYYSGFADEAGRDIDTQIKATLELGWKNIEMRNVSAGIEGGGGNLHNISDEEFEIVKAKLDAAGVKIDCFGSEVANWGKNPLSDEDFERSKQELSRALPRMAKLGTKMIRAMSFKRFDDIDDITPEVEKRIFSQVEYLVKMCEDAGVLFMHENCMNYGGMSAENTLKLLDSVKSDALKLVFDTGNPVMTYDYAKPKPHPKQSSWEFYSKVKDFVERIHIKDATYIDEGGEKSVFSNASHHFPGEGSGEVKRILEDALKSGFDGALSIEPHMTVVFHDDASQGDKKQAQIDNYVEYGRRLMKLVESIKS